MKPKTVYLNGNFLSQSITGVQRFGIELIKQLDILAPAYNLHFILLIKKNKHPAITNSLKHILVKRVGFFTGKLWEQFDLLFITAGKPLISFAGSAPIFKHNQYFAIHDAAIYDQPKAFSYIYRLWYRSLNAIIAQCAKKIITVSQFSARRLQQVLNIDENKFAVVHNGGNHLSAIAADISVLQQIPVDKKIIFVVGSLNPNKNFKQIIAVAAALQSTNNIHFVIAGNINNKIFTSSSSMAKQLIANNITYLGSITDEQLKALYSVARCFLFLSLYEGFGIPVAEAMAGGCPVVCSNVSCMPELFAPYALMVDPHNTSIIVNAVKQLCFDDAYYKHFKESALSGALVYTWAASAQKILHLINQ